MSKVVERFAEYSAIESMTSLPTRASGEHERFSKIAEGLAKSSAFERMARQLERSSGEYERFLKITEGLAKSSSFEGMARQLERSSGEYERFFKITERLAKSSSFEGMVRQLEHSSGEYERLRKITGGLWQRYAAPSVAEALPLAAAVVSRAMPSAVAGALVAKSEVAAAWSLGELDNLRGQSFVIDVLASRDPNAQFVDEHDTAKQVSDFIDGLATQVQVHLDKVQTSVEVNGILQYVLLFIALIQIVLASLQTYYAANSATSSDIARNTTATEHLANVTESGFSGIERPLNEKLGKFVAEVDRLSQERLTHLAPAPTYVVRRDTPVTRERTRRSEQVGAVHVGELVTIRRFDKKWVEIIFFDFAHGHGSRGWMVKKYLKRLR